MIKNYKKENTVAGDINSLAVLSHKSPELLTVTDHKNPFTENKDKEHGLKLSMHFSIRILPKGHKIIRVVRRTIK